MLTALPRRPFGGAPNAEAWRVHVERAVGLEGRRGRAGGHVVHQLRALWHFERAARAEPRQARGIADFYARCNRANASPAGSIPSASDAGTSPLDRWARKHFVRLATQDPSGQGDPTTWPALAEAPCDQQLAATSPQARLYYAHRPDAAASTAASLQAPTVRCLDEAAALAAADGEPSAVDQVTAEVLAAASVESPGATPDGASPVAAAAAPGVLPNAAAATDGGPSLPAAPREPAKPVKVNRLNAAVAAPQAAPAMAAPMTATAAAAVAPTPSHETLAADKPAAARAPDALSGRTFRPAPHLRHPTKKLA